MAKPGPVAGSEGAKRISEAHKGGRDHDKHGGFGANPDRARDAGRRGGATVKERYGLDHYRTIGSKGGSALAAARGKEHFAEMGRKGGRAKRANHGATQGAQS